MAPTLQKWIKVCQAANRPITSKAIRTQGAAAIAKSIQSSCSAAGFKVNFQWAKNHFPRRREQLEINGKPEVSPAPSLPDFSE